MIEILLNSFVIAFAAICFLCLLTYLPRMRGWFGAIKKQPKLKNEKNNRIALLIPARNESAVIGSLFDCIEKQTYPKEFFDVFVLVKDHNDPTIELCKKINAIPKIIDSQTCKGDALDVTMKSILNKDDNYYDAFLIVDADCWIEDNYMEEMNNALASGRQVISSKKIVKNYKSKAKKSNSLWSSCNGLIWSLIDDMGNRYKSDRNITNMVIGTGFMMRADVVRELGGWPYRQTLTEDIELMYDCAVKGYTTFYYSHAKIYVEEATSLKVTNKRRVRWLTGVVDSHRIYKKVLKETATTKEAKRNRYFTTALNNVFFYVGLTVLFTIAMLIFSFVLWLCGNSEAVRALIFAGYAMGQLYLIFWLMTLCCLIVDRKNMKMNFFKWLAVLFIHPIFYMWYIPIIARALFFRSNRGWEVIERVAVLQNE